MAAMPPPAMAPRSSSLRFSRRRRSPGCSLAEGRPSGFPVTAVEGPHAHALDRALVEATHVHAVAVGMRARHVERLDASHPAEEMVRGPGVEAVRGERLVAREEAKLRFRHDEVQVARAPADRAVALRDGELARRLELEAHAAAVAAAGVANVYSRCRIQQNDAVPRMSVRTSAGRP